jgi:hypothetical protein
MRADALERLVLRRRIADISARVPSDHEQEVLL